MSSSPTRLFVALFVVAVGLSSALLVFRNYEPPPPASSPFPSVGVRWGLSVTTSQREALELRYQLALPVRRSADPDDQSAEGRTWSYQLRDTSTGNLQRLVQDPAVEDTDRIDREEYGLSSTGRSRLRTLLPLERLLAAGLIGLVVAIFSLGFGLDRRKGVGARLTQGIQELPAEALGLFRVLLAVSFIVAFAQYRPVMEIGEIEANRRLTWAWVDWLLARPEVVSRLENAIVVLLGLFGVGLLTRLAYGLFAAAMTAWIAVMIQLGTNIHVWEVCYLMVLCLLPVPWGDAFSLDETLRRWRGQGRGAGLYGKRYGFAVWMPGFILGAVWAGAAYSKIENSGIQWILGGAVKYHWVVDAPLAPVGLGLWVATHHWAAVAMSFMGVALEFAFVLAAFAGSARSRLALIGAIGLPLLLGFFLFHGVLWWTWWLVLLSFALPWQAIHAGVCSLVPEQVCRVDLSRPDIRRRVRFWEGLDWFNKLRFVETQTAHDADAPVVEWRLGAMRSVPILWPLLVVFRLARVWQTGQSSTVVAGPAPDPPRPQPEPAVSERRGLQPVHAWPVAIICLLMVTQLPEGIGRFTSYSGTYASTADFDRQRELGWTDELWVGYQTPGARRVRGQPANIGMLADAIVQLSQDQPLRPALALRVQRVGETLVRASGATPERVTLIREWHAFDWEGGRVIPGERAVIGTLDLASMTLRPPDRP